MRKKPTELQKHAEKIRLRAAERRLLRERILSYMEYHPLQKTAPKKQPAIPQIESESFVAISLKSIYARAVMGTMVLLIIVGVPFAAERAVPGDALYPVKVRFNEEVRSTLSLTANQRVAWETRRVERRIAEARFLSSEGLLTAEAEEVIEEEVRAYTEAVQKELDVLRESDADSAAIASVTFETALEVQSAVLDTHLENTASSTEGGTVEGLAEIVRDATVTTQQESEGTAAPSYESFVAKVESETTRAYELFESISAAASADERTEIERRLEDTERLIARGNATGEENAEEAIALLRGALSKLQKIITFMTDIDVRENVALEILVPKELTDEERFITLSVKWQEANDAMAHASSALPFIEDASLLEKVEIGLADLELLLAEWDAHAEAAAIDAAEEVAVRATALAGDLFAITSEIVAPITEEEIPNEEEEGVEEEPAEVPGEEGTEEEPTAEGEVAITNFEECVAVTGTVLESFPRQCVAPDGTTYVEEVTLEIPAEEVTPEEEI